MLYYPSASRARPSAHRPPAAREGAGIPAHILRSPKSCAGEGCSPSVKISQRYLADALRALHRAVLEPKRVFITTGDGSYREVEL